MPSLDTRAIPEDWSEYTDLALWVNPETADGARIHVMLRSENPDTEGPDYYHSTMVLDWEGWQEVVLPLHGFMPHGEPLGLDQVTELELAARGLGAMPQPTTRLRLDEIRLAKE